LLKGKLYPDLPLYLKKRSPISNNFELFLTAFVEVFGKHDKIQWATIKIGS